MSPRTEPLAGAGGVGWGGVEGLASEMGGTDGVVRMCAFPFCLGRVDADTGGTSGDRRGDTKEPGRQQVCYLSQSEGEDLASRPCRMRGCPRHEGTQGLRSL